MSVDLTEFDEKAVPLGRIELATLPDGDYTLQIVKAALRQSEKKGTRICNMKCTVLSSPGGKLDGATIERPSFLTSQEAMNMLLADCGKLGFDSDQWKMTNNRPASQELPRALELMAGVKFSAEKKQSGTFHNINIKERLEDGKPKKFTAADLAEVELDPF